jgi:nicotinamidase-related amidase
MRIELLIIDPQISFCDPDGELFVPGADEDMKRLATMINRLKSKIDDIHVTLDSHHLFDISHPIYWKDSNGKNPDPFTIISVSDVENAVWTTTIPSLYKRALAYVKALEANGRDPLCIWPPHCLIGSDGHAVVPELFDALIEWERTQIAMVDYVTKGSNPFTEHYGVFMADVPQSNDPTTQINAKFLQSLENADRLIVAGEAGSHCVKFSLEDLIDNINDNSYAEKVTLLTDAMSPVQGFEQNQQDFIDNMVKKGVKTAKTIDIRLILSNCS